MLFQEKNEYGVISVDDAYLRQTIEDLIADFGGRAGLTNSKGVSSEKLVLFGRFDPLGLTEYRVTERGLYLKLYISVRFGESISEVARTVIDTVKERMADIGLETDDIIVVITAVYTSKAKIRREIIFSLRNEQPKDTEPELAHN